MSDPGSPHLRYSFEDPFATPEEARRSDRRLRGRLPAPVTVWTAASDGQLTGLTVSSVVVVEGEPPLVVGAVDPLAELCQMIEEVGKFTVHVLAEHEWELAARFAGQYPMDPFEGLEVEMTDFGPHLAGARTVASCRYLGADEAGYLRLVRAAIEEVELAPGNPAPLVHYRGRYRRLAP